MSQTDDEQRAADSAAPQPSAAGDGSTESRPESSGAWHTIGAAAVRAGVHQQTLRHYERLGLISPARRGTRPQSPRLYSERDIERVVHIRRLMGELGVNLAGVETILHMRDRMEAQRRETERELARLRQEYEAETRRLREALERLQR
jgi:MerR family transcriptional regulator/heat shock protein HspR